MGNKLYHYTTIDNLVKIVKRDDEKRLEINLRGTHHKYLNDNQEIELGQKYLTEEVLPFLKEVYPKLYEEVSGAYLEKPYYIVSFSKEKDCLPMWSMYGNGGEGVALEFDFDNFVFDIHSKGEYINYKYQISSCTYNVKDIEKIVSAIKASETGKKLRTYMLNNILNFLLLKNNAFQFENEHRLCFTLDYPDGHYVKNNLIVPYVNYYISPECLRSIVVGPSAQQERIKQSIEDYLIHVANPYEIPVTCSAIPFRKN